MTFDLRQKKYFSLGYKAATAGSLTTYGLFSKHHDCFVYLDADLDLMYRLQILLNPKMVLFIYQLDLPTIALSLDNTISNYNASAWTLDDCIARPSTQRLMHHFVHINRVDCREVNVLDQLSGLKKTAHKAEHDPDLARLIEWIFFVAYVVKQIKQAEHPADEIVSRMMIADNFHHKSTILDNDIFVTYSRIYKLLAEHDDVDQCTQLIRQLLAQSTQLFPWDQKKCLTI
jgi:hypothetical protein